MKQKIVIFIAVLFLTAAVYAEDGFFISADYNAPFENDILDSNVSFGANLGFWGIFVASADIYTQFIYGEDDFLHIDEIRPLGMYSWGVGIQIPLGGFYFDLDWKKFYQDRESSDIYEYSSSYSIGFHVKLSESFGVRVHRRSYYDFSSESGMSGVKKLHTLGAGAMIYL